MKKATSLLLALILCLSLCTCGSGNNTNDNTKTNIDILGEWVSVKNQERKLIFNEDDTCVTLNGTLVQYTVDYDAGIISIYDSSTLNYNIVEENGVLKLVNSSTEYVRAENYDAAHSTYVNQEISKLAKNLEGKAPIEFGAPYQVSNNFELTFLSCEFASHTTSYGLEIYGLWLTVTLRNLTNSTVDWRNYPDIGEVSSYIQTDSSNSSTSGCLDWGSNIDENGKRNQSLSNEAAIMLVPSAEVDAKAISDSASCFGQVLGFATFEIDNIEYYIDYSTVPYN